MTSGVWKQLDVTNLTKKLLSVAVLLFVLAACGSPTKGPTEPGDQDGEVPPPPPPPQRTLTSWTIDPDFSVADLDDATTRAWYKRIELEVAKESKVECLPADTPPEDYPYYPSSPTLGACSGVKHYIGRIVNRWVTSLLSVFRLTGDPALLEEVDRLMEITRAQLEDTDGDGWRNFKSLASITDTDFNTKEDDLSHAFIPEVIYVFKKNAAYSTPEHDYAAHADAWLSYLRNDFEPKWADKKSKTADTEGIPVRDLMHPYINMVRYADYMDKLLPQDAKYQRLEKQLSTVALDQFKTDMTAKGPAYVWSHAVRQAAGKGPNDCLAFQMGTYPSQTILSFLDLALEGVPGFAAAEALKKLSRTVSESILEPSDLGFLYKDVGGPRNGIMSPTKRKQTVIDGWCFKDIGYNPGSEPGNWFRSEGSYRLLNYAFYAAFAPDKNTPLTETEIYRVNRDLYGDPADPDTRTSSVFIPAGMVFARLYNAGNYILGD